MRGRVRITDVAPRDGLQNEPRPIPTADKARLVNALLRTGVDEVEVTSFVSPRWVPQLGDAAELLPMIDLPDRPPLLSALVPNERGMESLLAASAGPVRLGKIAVFTAASETFTRRNVNATIAESIDRFRPVLAAADANRLATRAYISCVISCPFEGPTPPARVAEVAERLLEIGADELDLGDTIGAARAGDIERLLEAIADRLGEPAALATTLHLHDTRGGAADRVREALALGVRSFDASAGGLGGCPYASKPGARAPGNISTESLLAAVTSAGFETGVQPDALRHAASIAHEIVRAGVTP